MGTIADLLTKLAASGTLGLGEITTLAREVARLESIVSDLGRQIGGSGAVTGLRAGGITLDQSGLHAVSTDGKPSVDIGVNGNASFGDDLSKASGTNFKVFSVAELHNDENFEAGDILLGDNSSDKANIKWDKSTGQWLFRGGTTTNAYIGTDGKLYAGAGTVYLDTTGIGLLINGGADAKRLKWTIGGTRYCWVESQITGDDAEIIVGSEYTGGSHEATVTLSAVGQTDSVGLSLHSELGLITDTSLTMAEISDPAAPAGNHGVFYCRDNGAGKSQLVARFPSGVVQVIATEP